MKKYSLKKHVAILLAALMAINTNISAFAQNNYDSTAIQSENAPSGSVIMASKHEVQLRQEYILSQALERLQLRQLEPL